MPERDRQELRRRKAAVVVERIEWRLGEPLPEPIRTITAAEIEALIEAHEFEVAGLLGENRALAARFTSR